MRFLDHTQRRATVGRTPLDEWSAGGRNLYLTTHNTHNRQTSMPPVRFEPTISAGERPQTCALDRAVTGTGFKSLRPILYNRALQATETQGYSAILFFHASRTRLCESCFVSCCVLPVNLHFICRCHLGTVPFRYQTASTITLFQKFMI
jgi:hypothetical protein